MSVEGDPDLKLLRGYNGICWQVAAVLCFLFGVTSFGVQPKVVQNEPPGTGPFSRMSMTLVKRLLFVRVDVLDLEVYFGVETSGRLEAVANGRELTLPLENSIAEIATRSKDAYIRLRFLRDIGLNRFLEEAKGNTKMAFKANIISESTYKEISQKLPGWYSGLEGRGIKKDDLMLYRVQGDGLRTIYRGKDGRVYVDQEQYGQERRLAVLGSYFAPKSDFRDSLIRSLFSSPLQGPSE
jgi:hypothetical protein